MFLQYFGTPTEEIFIQLVAVLVAIFLEECLVLHYFL